MDRVCRYEERELAIGNARRSSWHIAQLVQVIEEKIGTKQ